MANHYDVGDLVRVRGTFTDADGDVHDPTAVLFTFKAPSDDEATSYTYGEDAELVKSSTGVYYVDVDADEAGDWWCRFHATGTGQAAAERSFKVEASKF